MVPGAVWCIDLPLPPICTRRVAAARGRMLLALRGQAGRFYAGAPR